MQLFVSIARSRHLTMLHTNIIRWTTEDYVKFAMGRWTYSLCYKRWAKCRRWSKVRLFRKNLPRQRQAQRPCSGHGRHGPQTFDNDYTRLNITPAQRTCHQSGHETYNCTSTEWRFRRPGSNRDRLLKNESSSLTASCVLMILVLLTSAKRWRPNNTHTTSARLRTLVPLRSYLHY